MTTSNMDFQGARNVPRRVGVVTRRHLSQQAFHATMYEAEDVLAGTCDVDLIEVLPGQHFALKNRWLKRLVYRSLSPRFAYTNPGVQTIPLATDYDVLIVFCQNIWDVLHFNALRGWKEHCKTTVLWLEEFWAAEILKFPDLFRSLERFDHIVVCSKGSVRPLSEFLGRQVHLVPIAVDTLRFGPAPNWPTRSIDVFSMGRRWDGVHTALLGAASRQDLFYVHDTGRGMAEVRLISHKEHRDHYANLAKRSKYFMVAPAKMNVAGETLGQVEVGFRYFEGTAAGAVLVGQAPDCEPYREHFPWPDAVVEAKPDGSDILRVIADLEAEPERVRAISRRNVAEAMRRNDWIHRWIAIFEIAGVVPSEGMLARVDFLNALSQVALRHTGAPAQGNGADQAHVVEDRGSAYS